MSDWQPIETAPIDWSQHRFRSDAIDVVFTPRETYKGRPLKPGMAKHAGETVKLYALWLIEPDESYPGEWALGRPEGGFIFGDVDDVVWIASGDVSPISPRPSAPADIHAL